MMNVLGRRNPEIIPTKNVKQTPNQLQNKVDSSTLQEVKNRIRQEEIKIGNENDLRNNDDGSNNVSRNINASSISINASSSNSSSGSSSSSSSSSSEAKNVPNRIQPNESIELSELVDDGSGKYSIRHRENVSVFIDMVGQSTLNPVSGTTSAAAGISKRKLPVSSEKMTSFSIMRKFSTLFLKFFISKLKFDFFFKFVARSLIFAYPKVL